MPDRMVSLDSTSDVLFQPYLTTIHIVIFYEKILGSSS